MSAKTKFYIKFFAPVVRETVAVREKWELVEE